VVGFDSIILPGRVGSITEKIKLTNYRSGSYSKTATITSNAKKEPTLTITMKWVIKAYVAVAPTYLEITRNKDGVYQADVTLSSEKADLKLQGISFKPAGERPPSDKSATWQEELSVPVTFTLLRDTVVQGKMHDYKYRVIASYPDTKSKNGDFIFKTNHPDAPEVKISGAINPGPGQK
jgi:hypothetical protein